MVIRFFIVTVFPAFLRLAIFLFRWLVARVTVVFGFDLRIVVFVAILITITVVVVTFVAVVVRIIMIIIIIVLSHILFHIFLVAGIMLMLILMIIITIHLGFSFVTMLFGFDSKLVLRAGLVPPPRREFLIIEIIIIIIRRIVITKPFVFLFEYLWFLERCHFSLKYGREIKRTHEKPVLCSCCADTALVCCLRRRCVVRSVAHGWSSIVARCRCCRCRRRN
mmetsp:Transcript_21424/g.61206  ORF Transcript_21424/g.61206 Transcript_21424/m.61206 type:complete len:222 (-) Transcript_21424:247-912(-)